MPQLFTAAHLNTISGVMKPIIGCQKNNVSGHIMKVILLVTHRYMLNRGNSTILYFTFSRISCPFRDRNNNSGVCL